MMEIFDKKLIFSTTENILHLCAVETIYCVSIFYTAPPMFDQIYTIDAFVDHVMFPLVFSLQPQIDTVKYNRFLTLLKDIVNRHIFSISPRKFSLSFECASQQYSYVHIPNCRTTGLFLPLRKDHLEKDSGMRVTN